MKLSFPFGSRLVRLWRYRGHLTRVSIRVKILVPILLVILVTGGMLGWTVHLQVHKALWRELSHRMEATLSDLAHQSSQRILVEDLFALTKSIRDTVVLPDVLYVFIEDYRRGTVVHSFEEDVPASLLEFTRIPMGRNQNVVFFRSENGLVYDYGAKLLGGGVGTVHIGVTPARVHEQSAGVSRRIFLVTGLAAAVSTVLIYFIAYVLTEPILTLTRSLQRVGEGDFSLRTDIDTGDEIGELASQFNAMTARLERWKNRLQDAQKLLVRSERLATIGKIASGVAHEIGNPLHAVRELSRALEEQPGRANHYLPLIYEGLGRIHRVVSQLNSYARERPIRRRPVDLNEIVRETVAFLACQAEQEEIQVVFEPGHESPRIHGDPYALGQVITNMLINSLDATPKSGTIRITTFPIPSANGQPSQVGISIADSGAGIPDSEIARIFDPFFTTKEAGYGTGLGLAICHDIIGLHGGHIEVESSLGKGTTMTMGFPKF